MKLITGLGNIGEKYANTRHNVGWQIADRLQSTVNRGKKWEINKKFQAVVCRLKDVDAIIAKPTTFMNNSGVAVSSLATFYKLRSTDIYVIHDDLDIKLGEYKIQFGKGPKEHNGIRSIEEKLGTENFWRVRIGIENRFQQIRNPKSEIRNKSQIQNSKTTKISGEQYVLQKFEEMETEIINKVIDEVVGEIVYRIMN